MNIDKIETDFSQVPSLVKQGYRVIESLIMIQLYKYYIEFKSANKTSISYADYITKHALNKKNFRGNSKRFYIALYFLLFDYDENSGFTLANQNSQKKYNIAKKFGLIEQGIAEESFKINELASPTALFESINNKCNGDFYCVNLYSDDFYTALKNIIFINTSLIEVLENIFKCTNPIDFLSKEEFNFIVLIYLKINNSIDYNELIQKIKDFRRDKQLLTQEEQNRLQNIKDSEIRWWSFLKDNLLPDYELPLYIENDTIYLNKNSFNFVDFRNFEHIPLNLLLKGVPGTGKSLFITEKLKELQITNTNQVLRINIHSGTNNSDLMQGISVKTQGDNIIYSEKYGLILKHLFSAIQNYQHPYVIILEEIQENSLNKIIGDLIYLIEPNKRVDLRKVNSKYSNQNYKNIFDYIRFIIRENNIIDFVKIPNLIANNEDNYLIFPHNLYVFCTTNYREDKKIIEDNLLRRFDIIELYPDRKYIKKAVVGDFFEILNKSIINLLKEDETHPDRFLIGHASWILENEIYKPLLKTLIEFKEIKNLDFNFIKKLFELINNEYINNNQISPLEPEIIKFDNYKNCINYLQSKVYNALFKNDQ